MPDRQINAPIEEEMRKSYLDYAMSVIVGRALPDIRDGLKPVHRRVLYTMSLLGLAFNRGYKKSARVVGDCMGKFHPHGDSAIYDTLVLPTRIPNLLVNGSTGIAVGMATNIPPHNLTEVVGGLLALIDNPAMTIEQLMQIVKGPDFPTAAYIYGAGGIREAYTTGRGTITLRAKLRTEEMRGGRKAIVITELHYQ